MSCRGINQSVVVSHDLLAEESPDFFFHDVYIPQYIVIERLENGVRRKACLYLEYSYLLIGRGFIPCISGG